MIEAPFSKHNRSNYKIYMALCLGVAAMFAYDGFLSRYPWSHRTTFYEEHTQKVLFRTGAEPPKDLDNGFIPPELRPRFEQAKAPLSSAAVASVEEPGRAWSIADQAGRYRLVKEQDGLAAYKMGPDETMLFNQISPAFFVAGAVILAIRLRRSRNIKLVAEENELIVAGREKIPYDAIDSIDRTYFEKKGFFTIIYKKPNGGEARRKLSDRDYDNLAPILDHLIDKIS